MKNGKGILLLVCALSFALVVGVFIGRNLNSEFARLPENSESEMSLANNRTKDYRLDINTATKVQLMELPGIGEMTADRIIAYRTENGYYTSIEELLNVEGIGEKKLRQLENLINVGG